MNINKPNPEFLEKNLVNQIDSLLDSYKKYNKSLPDFIKRSEADYKFARDFFVKVISQRNARSKEVTSDKYKNLIKFALSQLPVRTYTVLCMDGRVLPTLVFGFSYGIAGSIRVPGGKLQEFERGTNGKKFLQNNSTFALLIDKAFEKEDIITQVFDSHVGCAARNGLEEAAGITYEDKGLLKDVLHKNEMAQATKDYVESKYKSKKNIIPIQTSFDPHNGYMFMGFETESALDYANKNYDKNKSGLPEFSNKVIKELIMQNKLLSTKQIADEYNEIFEKHTSFELDWVNNYVSTAENFWKSIQKLKIELDSQLKQKIIRIYPYLKNDTKINKIELEERAILLLANAYSGFMLNRKTNSKKDSPEENVYGFGDHEEEFIKIYEGGQPPYETSAFVLFSLDQKNLSKYIPLASGLVRNNRRDGGIKDHFGYYKSQDEFVRGLVPVVVHEIVREEIKEETWSHLSAIDWTDLPNDWDTMTDQEFFDFLEKKGLSNFTFMKSLNNLRNRMIFLYDPNDVLASRLNAGDLIALPTILSRSRKNRFVVPFVKNGFEEQAA